MSEEAGTAEPNRRGGTASGACGSVADALYEGRELDGLTRQAP